MIDGQNSFAQEMNHFGTIILQVKAASVSLYRESALCRSDKVKRRTFLYCMR